MGFHSFIAGRPFPVLCQLFQQQPCSASPPAFAMGHVPLLDLGGGEAKQLCESQKRYRMEWKPGANGGIVVPFPLLRLAALFLDN